jgi:hypothetical protein
MFRPREQKAVVSHRLGRGHILQVLERRVAGLSQTPAIIQDYRVPAPGGVPVIGGVQVEKVRPDFAPGIAMRRDRATVWRVVPMKVQIERANSVQPLHKMSVIVSPQLLDEFLPRRRDVQLITVFEGVAIVAFLPMFPLLPEAPFKKGDIRQRSHQTLMPLLCQEPLGINPGEGLLGPEGHGIDSF